MIKKSQNFDWIRTRHNVSSEDTNNQNELTAATIASKWTKKQYEMMMFSSYKYDNKFRFFFTYLVGDIVRYHICHLHTLLAVCARPAMPINCPFDYLFHSIFDHPKADEGKI
jgi:hypothetical protein